MLWDRERHPDIYPEPCSENGGRPVHPTQIGRQVMLYVPGAVRNKLAHLHAGAQFSKGQFSSSVTSLSKKKNIIKKNNKNNLKDSIDSSRSTSATSLETTSSDAAAGGGGDGAAAKDSTSRVDQQKLFEFRRASILFVNLPGIDYSADAETVRFKN